jgi:serine protease Do
MKPSSLRRASTASCALVSSAVCALALVAFAASAAPPPLPPLVPDQAPPDAGGHPAATEETRKGVVTVELGGRAVGIGMVLGGDGRVLTALSALGGGEQADLRYSDGHVVKARLGHKDASWDLALLVPQSGRWTEGFRAGVFDPGGDLRVYGLLQGKVGVIAAKPKGDAAAVARGGAELPGAFEIETPSAPLAGTPIVDATGSAVGIVARACRKPADGAAPKPGPCVLAFTGIPTAPIRNFLVRTPVTAVAPTPWVGVNGAPDQTGVAKGVRVIAVAPGSPAEKAGLKAGADLIVAVDGTPVETPERMADLIAHHAVGETVKVLVLSGEKFREVGIVLRPAP